MNPKRASCDNCLRPLSLCYCHLISELKNAWPIYLIQHKREQKHPLGTARIVQLALNKLHTLPVEDKAVFSFQEENSLAWEKAVLIYPDNHSKDISELCGQAPRPLVFIDATWKKSTSILFSSPDLQDLPRYSFKTDSPPRYLIRKAAKSNYYSTLEAICLVLGRLEKSPKKYEKLLAVMDWMVAQQSNYIKNNNAQQ